jgi:hypothetical protein
VSDVIPLKGAFYIFKKTGMVPERDVTLDEARPRIEQILRGAASDKIKNGTNVELASRFAPVIAGRAVDQFWAFVDKQTGHKDAITSDTLSSSATKMAARMTSGSETSQGKVAAAK